MGRLVETGRSALRSALERVGRGLGRVQERRPLSTDLLESDDAYLVVFDAPGVRGEDVDVTFLDRTVEVNLERFRDFYDGYDLVFPGRGVSLSGRVDLPRDADVTPEGANATLTRNGTLHVEIPKRGGSRDVDVVEESD
ncbi:MULTISPECIES: Hsp20/alpha crystallin family protein [Halorubrum]|uniref:Heat-shock protein Hsp20 n=1 Tax=Halorubrum tropicale TaxID=1765655 RepID=A0A0M9AQ39_9EURY|nr:MULTISPECIES: Hsp20/alpha crystallin family protein [Halorubrum]KOX96462.1 heat-shock protein Hsp20 [Halorubrum tropicale]TKX44290.1 Hsp20/alpha crystallin family protein [Halorubrum sp. ARQ200]TKX50803.1 Hsp20/alpha crystallin family protein [Halorubrum sp. ASP121]TKX63625.1 Hsp20/alpha crystallin family protein [Halorubrum sp. ASP1]